MAAYELSVTLRGTLEEVEARVVRALRAQGFGVLRESRAGGGRPRGHFERYDVLGAQPDAAREPAAGHGWQLVVSETSGLVTVLAQEAEAVDDVLEAPGGRVATAPPRARLRAAMASLEGEP